MDRRVIFHIGLEKTGTTSFQRFCASHRRGLSRQGVLYPRFRAPYRPDHAALAAAYLDDRQRDYAMTKRQPDRARALAALDREIAASRCGTVLISAEHLSSRFDRVRALRLAEDFAAFRPRIVVVVRDPHARFLSAYATAVVSGGVLSLEAYAEEVFDPANPYLDIARTLAPWEEAFGADRLSLVDYDAEADVVSALLLACGVDSRALAPATAPRSKVSPSPAAIRALRLCNLILRERQGRPAASFARWYQHHLFSKACGRELQRGSASAPARSWPITPGALARLDRVAATERQWLADRYGFEAKGGAARRRLVVTERPDEPGEAETLLARCLVARVTRGLWSLSEAAVSCAEALGRRQKPPPA